MKDFTLEIYQTLLQELLKAKYEFVKMEDYFSMPLNPQKKYVLMRHDVDRSPLNALAMARLESSLNIQATYYFRTIPVTFKSKTIKEISFLGHEIGYHYESLAIAKGDFEAAIKDFEHNLYRLRVLYPIKSIAMHGRPASKWDSRLLWEKYNYKEYGILSEPYFDLNFNKVAYITDASRSWNNGAFNRRDKVESVFEFHFKSTQDIIEAIKNNLLPQQVMFNIHPEHWAKDEKQWYKIFFVRALKNSIKRVILHR